MSNQLGDRIKHLRKLLQITQSRFAEETGITKTSVFNYENNMRRPDSGVMQKIIRMYNVNGHWLLTGEGEIFIDEGNAWGKSIEKLLDRIYPHLNPNQTRLAKELIEEMGDSFTLVRLYSLLDVLRDEREKYFPVGDKKRQEDMG